MPGTRIQDHGIVPDSARTPVWFNGRLVDWHDVTLHAATHVVNYGSGVFEGIRFYETVRGSAIFHLDAHLDRLSRSMELFGIESPHTIDEIARGCIAVALASGASAGYLRPQVQYGLSRLALGALDIVDAMILFWPMGKYRDKEGLSVVTSEIERLSPKAVPIEAKVIGFYTNSHFNHEHAAALGADEAVMLDVDGNVAEASSVNVFLVKDGRIFTPAHGHILRGITRGSVIELAASEMDLVVHEATVTPDDLRTADEIFFTGTAAEIEPVIEYDGRMVGDGATGPITTRLRDLYRRATRGELPGFERWLTPLR